MIGTTLRRARSCAGDVVAGRPGPERDVEQDDVELLGPGALERRVPVGDGGDPVALALERAREHARAAARRRRRAGCSSAVAACICLRRYRSVECGGVPAIRLHDTALRHAPGAPPVRRPGTVGIYACGPTVYNRIHVGNARPFVVLSLLKRFLRHEGYEHVRRLQHHRRQRQDLRRARGRSACPARSSRARWRRPTSPTPTGSGSGAPTTSRRVGDDGRDRRAHRRAARARPRLRGRGRRLLPRAQRPALRRRSRTATSTRWTRARAIDGAAARKEDPLDFALWKAQKPDEDTAWDAPWGARPARLAHRVLGDGRGAARRRLRGPRRRHDLVFPHHENEAAQTRCAHAAPSWRGSGCTTGCSQIGEAKMAKTSATSRRWPTCSRAGAATRCSCSSARATTASRWPSPTTRSRRRSGRVARLRELGRRLADGPSPPELAAPQRRVLRRAGRRLQHAGGAGRALRSGSARPTPAPTGRAGRPRRPRRDARRARAGGPARPPRRGTAPTPRRWTCCAAARTRARARDWAEADRLRDELAARGWEVRDGPAARARPDEPPAAAAWRRGAARQGADRPGPRAPAGRRGGRRQAGRRRARAPDRPDRRRPDDGPAARSSTAATRCARRCAPGAGAVHRVWATAGRGARAVARPGVARRGRRTPTSSPSAPAPTPTRACAPTSRPYPVRRRRGAAGRPDPLLVALDEVQDPQNVGAIAARPSAPGADRASSSPERRAAEVTPAVCKASAGAVEHLADRPGPQPRRLPARGQGGRLLGLRRRGGAGAVPYDEPDYAGGVVLVLGAEGGACARASRAPATQLVALPLRGRIASLNVSRRGGRAAVRDLAAPHARLDKRSITVQSAAPLRLDLRLRHW